MSGLERLRAKHAMGGTPWATFINLPSPGLVEITARLGADLVVIDGEHGPMGMETVEQMVRAADASRLPALVRLPYPDPRLVNRALDTGAWGVLVPHIDSADLAETIVRAAKYHPRGDRGAGAVSRAGHYGIWSETEPYAAWANANTTVFGILEDARVVDELPSILAVDGLDGFFVGHSDLSHSLGIPGDVSSPVVNELVTEISRAVLDSEKLLGRVVRGDERQALEDAARLREMGVAIVGVTLTGLLAWSAERLRQAIGA